MAEFRDEYRSLPNDQRNMLGRFLADQASALNATNVPGPQWIGLACFLMSAHMAMWQEELKSEANQ